MIVLDTDHLSVLQSPPSPRRDRLVARLSAATEEIGTTVISFEEQVRGWLAAINKERLVRRQVYAYRELADLPVFFAGFHLVPFDDLAAERVELLRTSKVRIGTSDLKIAAITLIRDDLLLTANRQDFERVPGLRFENWLD